MNLSAIDLNLLVVLDAVLAERSVARAAKRLHVTSPAVSNALGRLRSTLGDPIVARSGRGIVPTPRAAALGPAIARALADLERALGTAEVFDATSALGLFTLAIGDAGQSARLPDIARAMTTKFPRARLRVVNVDTMVALGGLAGTEVDVAIGVPASTPGIHREVAYEESSVLVARKGHPRLGERVRGAALARERHVAVHIAFGQPSQEVEKAYARLRIARDIAVVVPTFTAAAAIVAKSDLVANIPRSVVPPALRIIESPLKTAPTPMFLSWHERTHHDPAMKAFRTVIADALSPRA